jgi:hypothetical protein
MASENRRSFISAGRETYEALLTEKTLLNQETPSIAEGGLTLRLGTDLLSHVLPQYHRLWRA